MKKNSQNRSQVKTFWHSVGQMEREARDHCIVKNNFLLSSMILGLTQFRDLKCNNLLDTMFVYLGILNVGSGDGESAANRESQSRGHFRLWPDAKMFQGCGGCRSYKVTAG